MELLYPFLKFTEEEGCLKCGGLSLSLFQKVAFTNPPRSIFPYPAPPTKNMYRS